MLRGKQVVFHAQKTIVVGKREKCRFIAFTVSALSAQLTNYWIASSIDPKEVVSEPQCKLQQRFSSDF
jgi:hypothetical protein